MRGLIRNNLYSVGSALKWTIAFCLVLNVAVIIGAIRFTGTDSLLPMLMLGQIGSFVGLTGTALQKDNVSKWSKFERTLPVKLHNIVLARYISFLLFSVIGILLATITVLLSSVISTQPLNLERVGYGYGFGITFALLVPSILYPLVLKFGADKSEIMLMVSVVITLGLFMGGGAILPLSVQTSANANVIYRTTFIVISIVAFISSYFISLGIYKRKEF